MEEFAACFAELDDPRGDNARHDLIEILTIAFCTVLCGGEDCSDMALFGRAKEPFLRQFMQLRHGIPSHDTFSRVFRLLDPAKFQSCFLQFRECFAEAAQGVIAIDGKTLRRSFDRAADRACLQRVAAWGGPAPVGAMRRLDVTDEQWRRLEPLLPPEKPRTGRPNHDHRRGVSGMLWIHRTGAPWRDLPERYGPVGTVSSRFYRWCRAGVWDRILSALQAEADARGEIDWDLHFVDATIVRAHQHAAGARRTGAVGG